MKSQDVQDILSFPSYKTGATLRISPSLEPLPKTHYSLLAVSQLFGWAVVVRSSDANPSCPSSFVLTRLDDLQTALGQADSFSPSPFDPDQYEAIVIPTSALCSDPSIFITHVAFASWDRLIIVVTSDGSLHIFSLYDVTNQGVKTPTRSIPSPDHLPLKTLAPNPSKGGPLSGSIVAIYQNGAIKIFDSYQTDRTYWSAQLATAAEWSPMGKRLLVGYTDGRLEFVTHEGEIKGMIEPPALVKEQQLAVSQIKWLDQKNYLVTFIQPIDGPDVLSETYGLHVPRQADPSACIFGRIDDAFTSNGATGLLPDILSLTLPVNPQTNWKHLTISTFTLSTTLTLIGHNTSDEPVSLYLSEDGRPEIPATEEDYSPAAPLGLATSYCAQDKLPLIWSYTTDGVLAVWKVKLVSPSLDLSQVWNETSGYSDISTAQDKGNKAPPTATASLNFLTGAASSKTPQAGLASSQSSVSAFSTPSKPLASSQVTAFGKPPQGTSSFQGTSSLSQSNAFGTSSLLNQSASSTLAFGKTSLGSTSSPFANSNLFSGSTSSGFSSFASPSPLGQVAGTSTLSALAGPGFAAFSSSTGNTGSTIGFSAFSNSPDKPRSGLVSFANSAGKAVQATSNIFEQTTPTSSLPSFFDDNTTAKTPSIFDNTTGSGAPSMIKESQTPVNNSKLAFGGTKQQGPSFSTPQSKDQTHASHQPFQNSLTFQARATANDEDDQRSADARSIVSGASSPSSVRGRAEEAKLTKSPVPGFDISTLGLSTNADTLDHLSEEIQRSSVSADDQGSLRHLEDKPVVAGFNLTSPDLHHIEGVQTKKPSPPSFDLSSLGLSIQPDPLGNSAGEQLRAKAEDEGDQSTLEAKTTASSSTSSLSVLDRTHAAQSTEVLSAGLDTSAESSSIKVNFTHSLASQMSPEKHLAEKHPQEQQLPQQPKPASAPPLKPSSSFGFGGLTLPNPMRPSPLGSGAVFLPKSAAKESNIDALPCMPPAFVAPPEATVSRDVLPTPDQISGASQPGYPTPAELQPKASTETHDNSEETQLITSDSREASSITPALPADKTPVPGFTQVERADAQLNSVASGHLQKIDPHPENQVDALSDPDDDISDDSDSEPSQSEDQQSLESEDDQPSGSEDVTPSENDEQYELANAESVGSKKIADAKSEREARHHRENTPQHQSETSLIDESKDDPDDRSPSNDPPTDEAPQGRAQAPIDERLDASTPKSLFGLTSSPPSKLKRSVTSSREITSQPAESSTQVSADSEAPIYANSYGLPHQTQLRTAVSNYPPDSQSSTASVKTSLAQVPTSHAFQSTSSQLHEKAVSSPKPQIIASVAPPSLPPPFLVTRPEFTIPLAFLSAVTVPKIYVNSNPGSFSKPDEGLDQASSNIIDSIAGEIDCLKFVSSVFRRYLRECCKKLAPQSPVVTRGGPPNLFFGDLSDVLGHVQALLELAKKKKAESEARLQAVTALDNAHIKADMKLEEIKRILRLRHDPGFSQVIRSRQLGPVQLAHQKDMRRLIRDVKHGISQMSEVLQSFESRHREASTQKNKIQPPSLDTINRCIRFITQGLTQHIINLEKLHLRVCQQKAMTSTLKDTKESFGVGSLPADGSSRTPDQAEALRALMSEHRGAILKELILKRGDEPILTRAQTSLPANLSGESSGLSHIRASGVILIRP